MQRTISQRQLRNDSGEIMRAVEAGISFLVTRNGVPVGELTPVGRRKFVRTEELIEAFKGLEPIDLKRLREDNDAWADPDPTPRV